MMRRPGRRGGERPVPGPAPARAGQGGLGRSRHLSIRARLTLTYIGVVAVSGSILIALVSSYTRYVADVYIVLPAGGEEGIAPGDLVPPPVLDDIAGGGNRALESAILWSALAALLLLTLLSGMIGWVLAGRMLRPLSSMSAAAKRAASGDLSQRLALSGPHDEIHDLADTFDGMLSSLERSLNAHRRFAANASHELRTPLATTQTLIDVALSNPRASQEDLRAALVKVRRTNRANREMIDALLDLADAQAGRIDCEEVDLGELVRAEMEALAPQARQRGLRVDCALEDCRVPGDPVLLRQAVSNLLRNAVRHNVGGGRVSVSTRRRPSGKGRLGTVRLTVDNDGPVIPADRIPVLHEPFVRGQGRSRGSGHGLGLAIVSAVAAAHGGGLHLSARPAGGLGVVMDLPGSPDRS